MTRLAPRVGWAVAVGVVALQVALSAQDRNAGTNALAPMDVQRLLDAYVLSEAEEALGLTDEQYPEFLTQLRALQTKRRDYEQRRLRLITELNRLSTPHELPPRREAMIRERLDALDALESSAEGDLREARAALVSTLTLRQRARWRVLEERLEQQKLQLLQRVRPAGRGAGR